jgi:1-acyl-sn-glycerol-3-phosphate acyltransferase
VKAAVRAARSLWSTLAAIGDARLRRDDDVRARAGRFRAAAAELCAIHGFDVVMRGSFPSGPAIVVANHVSYLDPIVIASRVACAPISKGEVADWPVIGAAGRSLGVHFVTRECTWSGARTLRRALATLRGGAKLLNFPEGTTTDGTELLPFRRGVFGLARITGLPIVPVALRYTSPDLAWYGGATFLPHYLRTASRDALAVHVDVGSSIHPDRLRSADDLARFIHHRIARMLRDLEDPHGAIVRLRVPASRPDPVLPAPGGRAVAAR